MMENIFFCSGIGLSVVSLDKALETNHLSARVGDNVEIKCDVTGSPSPPIIWKRYSTDLSSLTEDQVTSLPTLLAYKRIPFQWQRVIILLETKNFK